MTQGVDNWTLIHNVLVMNTKSVYVFLGIMSDISVSGLGGAGSGVLGELMHVDKESILFIMH